MNPPATIDLFCGAGGITEGFRQSGFRCLWANDINKDALSTFALNHPETIVEAGAVEGIDPRTVRSVLDISKGQLDCLVGGPPCQGFSINAPDRVLDDPRNRLVRRFLDFVEEFEPKTVLIENVPGMLSLAGGHVVSEILIRLRRLGYDTSHRVLFAAHYGVPQERWRLIILASRTGRVPVHPPPSFNAKARANFTGGRLLTFRTGPLGEIWLQAPTTVGDALDDLPPLKPGEGAERMPYRAPAHSGYADMLRHGSTEVLNHVAPQISSVNLERLKHIQPGGSWRDIPFELLPEGMKKARRSDHTRRYGRLRADGLSGTVMTKMDPHWGPAFHYSQSRTLTVREAARLQSFPDRYRFLGTRGAQYEQVGNAVPVMMARAIADVLRQTLDAVPAQELLTVGNQL